MLVTNTRKINQYYDALVKRDESFVGIFFVGVKTTSIFCISTCSARKPKFENVEFYTTVQDAIEKGYRACKICKPTGNANETPELVQRAMELVKENPKQKVTDVMLKERGIPTETLRRWFNKHYGMTFQAYQRMYRVNEAYTELKNGKSTTDTAFDSGYESLSGFGYTFKRLIGKSPKNISENNVILIHRITTPLGPMFICATDKGVCMLEFVDRRMLETEMKDLQKRLDARIIAGENGHIRQTQKELKEYFAGKRKQFTVTLDTPGTDFQNTVWRILEKIPFGQTWSYQKQAIAMKKSTAVRAVASANGHNRIAIIIPCHRVIGKNGKLTGYGGGLERKRWLLDHERENL